MKEYIIIIIALIGLTAFQRYQLNQSNKAIEQLQIEIWAKDTYFDFKLRKAVIYDRLRVTDSLVNHYESLPPVVEVVEVVKWKHSKVADSVVLLSDSLKVEWIKSQIK